MDKKGFVYLIGAGPGDQGLITVKGMEALQKADVILYDNLVAVSLLNRVKLNTQLIYTGKRAGRHSMKQDEINVLIVQKAMQGHVVARLKGGDPFVFGRGGEEVLALNENNIPYEVISGVSSSYAVPAYAGIPVTHRGLASSVHVITGHEDETKEKSVLDYAVLAKLEGTLVFLMGLKNLPGITQKLMANGKSPQTPVAVIEKGTTAAQKMVRGTLENIVNLVSENQIKTPAITVIGDVTSLHNSMDWFGKKPLSGKRILITATDEISKNISEKVRNLGGESLEISLIYPEPINHHHIKKVMENMTAYTWIVLTSRNGVHIFFEQLKQMQADMRKLAHVRFAVIGHGTKEALAQYGIYADLVPEFYTSRHLGEALVPLLNKKDKLLLLRAAQGSKALTDILDKSNISYTALSIYDTHIDMRKKELLALAIDDVDYITFCSPSAVKALVEMIDIKPKNDRKEVDIIQMGTIKFDTIAQKSMKNLEEKVVCIGPVTAKAAKDAGLPVYKAAKQFDADGLLACIVEDI